MSFGANNPFILEGDTKRYENYLEHFDKISVREKNAQKWIKGSNWRRSTYLPRIPPCFLNKSRMGTTCRRWVYTCY